MNLRELFLKKYGLESVMDIEDEIAKYEENSFLQKTSMTKEDYAREITFLLDDLSCISIDNADLKEFENHKNERAEDLESNQNNSIKDADCLLSILFKSTFEKKIMSVYSDELNSNEWRKRRLEILELHNYECQFCYNKKLLEISMEGKIQHYYYGTDFVKRMLGLIDYSTITFSYLSQREIIENNSTLITRREIGFDELINHCKVYYLKANPEIITGLKSTLNKEEWVYSRVDVHHKYYQVEKKIWEYPDDALTLACRDCHNEIHDKNKIPIRDENGQVIREMDSCDRCGGAGYIEEFIFRDNGICYKCWGAGFL